MRTLLFIFILLALSSLAAQAQSRTSPGLLAGISQGWDLDNGENTIVNKPGFTAGVFLHVPISEFVRFQPELAFTQRIIGYDQRRSYYGSTVVTKGYTATNLIQLPLWLQFGRKTYVGIGGAFGTALSIKTVNEVTTTTTNPALTRTETGSGSYSFDPFEGIILDVGLSVGRRSKHVAAEIRPVLSFAVEDAEVGPVTLQVTAVLMLRK